MTTGAPAIPGINKGLPYILLVLVYLWLIPSCAKTLQDAPGDRKTYEHNRDRRNSALCAEWPNFAIDVPADWNLQVSDCDFVGLVSGNGSAELQAVITDLPDFPEDVGTALDEMQSRWVRGVSDADGSVKRVQHQGLPAISRSHIEPGSPLDACENYVDVLGVPAKSWPTHGKRAVVVAVARCTDAQDHQATVDAVLGSFQLVEPY